MNTLLRICTWNIKLGQQLPQLLKVLSQEKDFRSLDALALQETSVHSGKNDAEIIAQAMGKDYSYFQATAHMHSFGLQANAFIWNTKRITITRNESVFLPQFHESTLPRLENLFLRFLPTRQQRNYLLLEGVFAAQRIRFFVAHLDVLGFNHKRAQLQSIFDLNNKQKQVDTTILAGDFNTFRINPKSRWQKIAQDAQDQGFTDITSDIPWTFYEPRLAIRQKLDAIFLNPKRKSKTWTLPVKVSDHLPIFANISVL